MFGMGTGGSLRLLSPEIGQGPNPFAAAFLPPSVRPNNGLPASLERLSLRLPGIASPALQLPPGFLLWLSLLSQLRASHPQNRTGWIVGCPTKASLQSSHSLTIILQDQALDRLVSPSSMRYRTSTDDLSTLSSSRGLTCSMQWQFFSLGGLHA